MPHRLLIDRSWSGERLPPRQRSTVELADPGPAGLEVRIDAFDHGDVAPASAPGWMDGLWEYEVVELFIAGPRGYLELELGPYGHHLALFFERVRVRSDEHLALAPFEVERWGGRWRAEVVIPTSWLPEGANRAAAFAIHGERPHRVHLASCSLPGTTPDFHQPDHFPAWPAR